MPRPQALLRRAYDNPWLLITLTCVLWAGNVVAARLAIGTISPMLLVSGRWAIASVLLVALARRQFLADWPVLAPHWLRIGLMGTCGYTLYHALYYVSARYTTGVNLSIIQGISPVMVLLGAWALWRTRVLPVQALGCALSLLGISLVATHGNLGALRNFDFRIGDIGIVVASVLYAGYSLSLRNRPKASALGFFVTMALAALLSSLPLVAIEAASGHLQWPTTPTGWGALIYAAIFPSLLAQVFFIRGVELIGPGRATLFYKLTPVLGALFSAVLLGEAFEAYHAIALFLVIGGVTIAEWFRR